jgi:integrase
LTNTLRDTLQRVLRARLSIHLPERCDGLHLLRHTSGSWIYSEAGPKEAQAALRHASIKMTIDTYTHLPEGSEAQVLRAVFAPPTAPEGRVN